LVIKKQLKIENKNYKMKNGDIMKFVCNYEPCIVYRIIDATEIYLLSEYLRKYCAHIKIEAIGFIPLELIEPAYEHPKNVYALDNMLLFKNRLN
jgi:hypothetical protein